MPVVKHDAPILEYDTAKTAIINPDRHGRAYLPPVCVLSYFSEVLRDFIRESDVRMLNRYSSEMGAFPIYGAKVDGTEICVVQAIVGSGSVAMLTDYLIGYGVKQILSCGGCGVLREFPAGHVLVPTRALRDEGASYHYLPPARDVALDADMVEAIAYTLTAQDVPFTLCKTWTTAGFYRETPDMVAYRREEGCDVVEMECASIAAVAQFRGVQYGQLLYSGDTLTDEENYDDRGWAQDVQSRKRLFDLAVKTAVYVSHRNGPQEGRN